MTSTATTRSSVTFFDMSKMEKSTSSLLDCSDMDNSSWGELDLEGNKQDQFTYSTFGCSTLRSNSALGDVDDSSWGELDLDDIDEEQEAPARTTFARRATYAGPSHGGSLLDEISCPSMRGSSKSRQRQRDQEEDDDDKINELSHCLKSMYGDYSTPSAKSTSSSSSSPKSSPKSSKKTKSRRKSYTLAPALKRFTTA